MMKKEKNRLFLLQAAVFLLMLIAEISMLLANNIYLALGDHTMYFYNSLFFIPLGVLLIGIFSVSQIVKGNLEMSILTIQCIGAGRSVYVCYLCLIRCSDIGQMAVFHLYIKAYLISLLASLIYAFGLNIYIKHKIRKAEWCTSCHQ